MSRGHLHYMIIYIAHIQVLKKPHYKVVHFSTNIEIISVNIVTFISQLLTFQTWNQTQGKFLYPNKTL